MTAIVPDEIGVLSDGRWRRATAVLNGAGELTGVDRDAEWGILETPIVLTAHQRRRARLRRGRRRPVRRRRGDDVVVPVVGECDDSWLDDIARRWVTTADVRAAIDAAAARAGGRGCRRGRDGDGHDGYKAGIGTSSRVLAGLGTVGVLRAGELRRRRQPAHRRGARRRDAGGGARCSRAQQRRGGSCIGVVATRHPARRPTARARRAAGRARPRPVGSSVAHDGSGEIFCAVSTTNRRPRDASEGDRAGDALGAAIDDGLRRRRRRHRGGGHQRPVRRRHGERGRRAHAPPASPSTASSTSLHHP